MGSADVVIVGINKRFQRFRVEYEFPVVFTDDAFAPFNLHLRDILTRREPLKRHRTAVFIDAGVLHAHPLLPQDIARYVSTHADAIELAGDIVDVPGGELCKNDTQVLAGLLEALASRAIDRHSYAIAIGGGALLDVVGFASAIFHRGVRHLRLPSTLLAQADSGVGVKNAINWSGKKNLLGCFSPPWAVINDSRLIATLPVRQKRAGMAEAVKVALIRDRGFFGWMERHADALANFDAPALNHLIIHAAQLHMRQIAHGGDPFELGSARPLDYGHWAAHKLESLSQHALAHGEAVAIGIALDARYSCLCGMLGEGCDERIYQLLKQLGLPLWHAALARKNESGQVAILDGLADFQQHLGGELTITLLADIGRGVEVHRMNPARILQAIDWLRRKACN